MKKILFLTVFTILSLREPAKTHWEDLYEYVEKFGTLTYTSGGTLNLDQIHENLVRFECAISEQLKKSIKEKRAEDVRAPHAEEYAEGGGEGFEWHAGAREGGRADEEEQPRRRETYEETREPNVAVGAITVLYQRKLEGEQRPSGAPELRYKTYYLSQQDETKKLIAFESSVSTASDLTLWDSWLCDIDGHTGAISQGQELKAISLERLERYLSQLDDQYDEHKFSTEFSPCAQLERLTGEVLSTYEKFDGDYNQFVRHLALFKKAGAFAAAFMQETGDIEDEEDVLTKESRLDTEGPKTAAFDSFVNYSKRTAHVSPSQAIKNLTEIQKGFREFLTQKEKLQNMRAFLELLENLKKKAIGDGNKIYSEIWHSEQRLLYYLFGHLFDSQSGSIGQTFSWDTVEREGWDVKSVLLHVHSRLDFCEVCCYTLGKLVQGAYKEKIAPNVSTGDIPFFKVLASYREPRDKNVSERQELASRGPSEELNWSFLASGEAPGDPFNKSLYVKKVDLSP